MIPPACRVSVTVITRDEAVQIGACLDSVRWADEIVIVDTGSTDGTVELCQKYTPHVYTCTWTGYAAAKNAALAHATGEWILSLDADERVTAALQQEIAALRQQPLTALAEGYAIPRRNYLWGRWLRHGGLYPDYQIRFFRRGKGYFRSQRVHESICLGGRMERLRQPLEHYSYRTVSEVIERLNRYSDLAALDACEHGRAFRIQALVWRPLGRFLRNYVLKQGFRDGIPGLIMAVSYAYSVFAREAKRWELTQAHTTGSCPR